MSTLAPRPRMKSESLAQTIVSDDPGTERAVAINPEDLRSLSQLLWLFERQLDRCIDDRRYVSPWPRSAIGWSAS